MRRVEPAYPDLLPLSHRLGPVCRCRPGPLLDVVEMRLVTKAFRRAPGEGDRGVPRRPVRLVVHAEVARRERTFLEQLLAGGSGAVVVLDDELDPGELPPSILPGQVVVVAPWLPRIWGGSALPDLTIWRRQGMLAGVLLALAPCLEPAAEVGRGIAAAHEAGAAFAVAAPLSIPPADRHRAYDRSAGEDGDEALENLLFHSDLAPVWLAMEREASRCARATGLGEVLPGPATGAAPQESFAAVAAMLVWARRLDLMDGVDSPGWQLRRAANALLAARRRPGVLCAEDNLRIVPGFNPWVEAFARALWAGAGEPFDDIARRWECA